MEASRTLMLPPMGELSLNSLQPGECLVKQIGPWPHAMLGKIDYMPPCRTKPEKYDTHPYTPAKNIDELPEVKDMLLKTIAEHKQRTLRQAKQSQDSQQLGKLARTFLDYASLPKYEYAPVYIVFKQMGNPSFSTQLAVIKELEKNQLVKFLQFRASRSPIRLKEITNKGWDFLHKSPASQQGKGDTLHCHLIHWVYDFGLKQRYEKCVIEWLVDGTRHSCDVGFLINGHWHGIEIVVSCFENITSHIRACFIESNIVETLTIVTTQKSIWPKIEAKILSEPELVFFRNKIKFDVIETYMKELRS
jgi:hypothetical protein